MGEDAGVHFVVQYTLRDTPAFCEGMLGGVRGGAIGQPWGKWQQGSSCASYDAVL